MTLGVRRVARILFITVAAMLVVAGGTDAAYAHFAGGREPSSYRGEITNVSPQIPGVTFTLVDAADRIEVRSTSDTPVIIYGYQHKEPGDRDQYLKVSKDGVWVNTESQAGYLNQTLYGSGDAVPERLRNDLGDGEPVWEKVSDEGVYRWHDHRIHWMSEDPPPQVAADPGSEHHIIRDWTIYAKFGDHPESTLTGQLYWVPANPAPWWIVLGSLSVAAFVVGLGWRRMPLIALTGLMGVAALGQAIVTPLPQDEYQGSWSFVLAAAAVPALAVAGLCALAILAIRRGSDSARYLLGGAAALAALQGTSDLPVITRSQLEQHGPDWLARVVIAVVVGIGVGLLAAVVVRSLRAPASDDAERGGGVDIASDEEMRQIHESWSTDRKRGSWMTKRDRPPPRATSDGGV